MHRGRPVKSKIREKIAAILLQIGSSYGYEIYKAYKKIFGNITLRNLYYNLKKGFELGEFIIVDVKQEPGVYTWGRESMHVYYSIGPYAKTYELTEDMKIRLLDFKKRKLEINWEKQVELQIDILKKMKKELLDKKSNIIYEEFALKRNEIVRKCELLKEWIRNKFDKNKAHEIRVKIDQIKDGLHSQTPSFPVEPKTQDVEIHSDFQEK